MATLLPTLPRVVFSIVEPISLVVGFWGTIADPKWFINEQVPSQQVGPSLITGNSVVVAQQLGNLYLLMAFMGLAILNTTSEAKVVRGYLFALWLGDIGHVGFSAYALGMENLMKPLEWNAMIGGNIVFTSFLFLMRSAYFLGLFGPDKPTVTSSRKRA